MSLSIIFSSILLWFNRHKYSFQAAKGNCAGRLLSWVSPSTNRCHCSHDASPVGITGRQGCRLNLPVLDMSTTHHVVDHGAAVEIPIVMMLGRVFAASSGHPLSRFGSFAYPDRSRWHGRNALAINVLKCCRQSRLLLYLGDGASCFTMVNQIGMFCGTWGATKEVVDPIKRIPNDTKACLETDVQGEWAFLMTAMMVISFVVRERCKMV